MRGGQDRLPVRRRSRPHRWSRFRKSEASGEYESMKSRETLIRLKKFQVDERRRKVAQIEGMIAEFERMAGDLEPEIKSEQDRAGLHDPGHFAYPPSPKPPLHRPYNRHR